MLTLASFLLAVLMATLAYCMMNPVRWDGPGKVAAVALFFPLHLLVVTLGAPVWGWSRCDPVPGCQWSSAWRRC